MKVLYPALFHKEEDGFWVEFPDLDGCVTEGDSLEEATAMAIDALGAFTASLLDRGYQLPQVAEMKLDHPEDGFSSLICADTKDYHKETEAVKKLVSIPAWMEKAAKKEHLSLSKVLQEGLQDRLNM